MLGVVLDGGLARPVCSLSPVASGWDATDALDVVRDGREDPEDERGLVNGAG